MQQSVCCTMLCTHDVRTWAVRWVEELADSSSLRVRIVDIMDDTDMGVSGLTGMGPMLNAIRSQLQGSYLCLLPVGSDNLSWVRTWLSQMARSLPVPIMVVACGLRANSLRDLLGLGVMDFIRVPGCPDELRVRVERVLAQSRTAKACTDGTNAPCDTTVRAYVMGRLVSRRPYRGSEITQIQTGQIHMSQFLHRQPIATRYRNTIPQRSLRDNGLELEAFAVATAACCALGDESFKQAKHRVIENFEKTYLIAVLNRHGGNITQAAKAAQKHRRAFWELMRKHRIDISSYRLSR